MLYVPAEIAAIVKTKLLVFAVEGVGHDPLRATDALLLDLPGALKRYRPRHVAGVSVKATRSSAGRSVDVSGRGGQENQGRARPALLPGPGQRRRTGPSCAGNDGLTKGSARGRPVRCTEVHPPQTSGTIPSRTAQIRSNALDWLHYWLPIWGPGCSTREHGNEHHRTASTTSTAQPAAHSRRWLSTGRGSRAVQASRIRNSILVVRRRPRVARSSGSRMVLRGVLARGPGQHRQHEFPHLICAGQREGPLGHGAASLDVELSDTSLDPGHGRRRDTQLADA